MKVIRIAGALVLTGLLAGPIVACSETATRESTGQYIDDSAISNKVRAKLIDDPDLNVFQIDVTTYKGTVQLSGFVDSEDAKARAERVAASVDGVQHIENDLVVK